MKKERLSHIVGHLERAEERATHTCFACVELACAIRAGPARSLDVHHAVCCRRPESQEEARALWRRPPSCPSQPRRREIRTQGALARAPALALAVSSSPHASTATYARTTHLTSTLLPAQPGPKWTNEIWNPKGCLREKYRVLERLYPDSKRGVPAIHMIIAEFRSWALAHGRQDILDGVPPYTESKPEYTERVSEFRVWAQHSGRPDLLAAVPECTPSSRTAYASFLQELKAKEKALKARVIMRDGKAEAETDAVNAKIDEELPALVDDLSHGGYALTFSDFEDIPGLQEALASQKRPRMAALGMVAAGPSQDAASSSQDFASSSKESVSQAASQQTGAGSAFDDNSQKATTPAVPFEDMTAMMVATTPPVAVGAMAAALAATATPATEVVTTGDEQFADAVWMPQTPPSSSPPSRGASAEGLLKRSCPSASAMDSLTPGRRAQLLLALNPDKLAAKLEAASERMTGENCEDALDPQQVEMVQRVGKMRRMVLQVIGEDDESEV